MTEGVRPGLRERKKEATRIALRDSAVELFQENGYSATTIDQIADRANVSSRTFFRYFRAKDDVLYQGNDERVVAVLDFLANRPPGEALATTLSETARFLADDLEHHRDVLFAQAGIWSSDPEAKARALMHLEDVKDAISAHLAECLGVVENDDLRPALYAGLVVQAWRSGARVWLHSGGEGSLGTLVAEALALVSFDDAA